MIDCMKKYKMVLIDDDGNVYKSDNVEIRDANIYFPGCEEGKYAEIELVMRGLCIEEAETPLEMPTAEVAATASKIIQEEKRKAAIEREWKKLVVDIYHAIKQGRQYISLPALFKENKIRLEKKGYKVIKEKCNYEWEISWMEPEFQV